MSVQKKSVTSQFPQTGFLRLHQIIGTPPGTGPIPVSRAQWYLMMNSGVAPRPIKLGTRARAWNVEEIRALIDRLSEQGA